MPDFLLELGTEEIPAGYIQPALLQGAAFLKGYLAEHHLTHQDIKTYSTPRRMVFSISGLPAKQANINKELAGPPCSVAFDKDNKPTQAYFGFIKKYNLKESDVKTKDTPKGKACYASVLVKGEKAEKILAEAVPGLVKSLPFPKSMWWLAVSDASGATNLSNKALTFARPLRYILAIFGAKALKLTPHLSSPQRGEGRVRGIDSVPSGNKTYGHPFLAPKAIIIKSADFTRYQSALRKSKVIVDSAERHALIAKEIQKALDKHNGVCDEPKLLEEVTNLVEFPVAIECEFDESYLKLPAPVIESAMKSHQRYFPFKDKSGKLLNRFITVSNITANKEIKEGNERVIKARLSDALFFWEQDRKIPLEEYAKRLDSIAFLGNLGTMKEKSGRLRELALFIARDWCDDKVKQTIGRAAELCKADLLTGMVGEFPDLQGIMGYEYLKDKEPEVALAIKEHYQPRFSGDNLPVSKAGICLSLAEKFDNIVACFGTDLNPSGSSDPYGLRRQAGAIIDITRSQNIYALSLDKIINYTINLLKPHLSKLAPADLISRITLFTKDRLESDYLRKGVSGDLVNAVLNIGVDNIFKVDLRIKTIQKLSKESFWNELVEVVERTHNITKNAKADGDVNETLLKEKEEIELWDAYKENKDAIQKLIDAEQYEEASRMYHKVFAKPAHTFFEKVFVNVEDTALKNNRLTLLKKINQLYSSGIADLSRIPRK